MHRAKLPIYRVGQPIGYAKRFLRQIGTPATDPSWRRRGVVVAVPQDGPTPLYPHWKTGAPLRVPEDLILVHWADLTYPITLEDGEVQHAHSVRADAVAVVGSGRYAEDI